MTRRGPKNGTYSTTAPSGQMCGNNASRKQLDRKGERKFSKCPFSTLLLFFIFCVVPVCHFGLGLGPGRTLNVTIGQQAARGVAMSSDRAGGAINSLPAFHPRGTARSCRSTIVGNARIWSLVMQGASKQGHAGKRVTGRKKRVQTPRTPRLLQTTTSRGQQEKDNGPGKGGPQTASAGIRALRERHGRQDAKKCG